MLGLSAYSYVFFYSQPALRYVLVRLRYIPAPETRRCQSTRSSWGPQRRWETGRTLPDRDPAWAQDCPAAAP